MSSRAKAARALLLMEGMEILESVSRMFELMFYMDVYPLKFMEMFPKATNYAEMVNILNTQKNYIIKTIEEHESTIDPEHPRDFVDMFLKTYLDLF